MAYSVLHVNSVRNHTLTTAQKSTHLYFKALSPMGILVFPCYSVLRRQIIDLVKLSGNCSVKCFALESAGLSKQNPSMGTVRGIKVKNSAENVLNSENHLSCDCSADLSNLSSVRLHSQGH